MTHFFYFKGDLTTIPVRAPQKSKLGISHIVSSRKLNNIVVFVSTLYRQLLF